VAEQPLDVIKENYGNPSESIPSAINRTEPGLSEDFFVHINGFIPSK
jgi:hypothetical protein